MIGEPLQIIDAIYEAAIEPTRTANALVSVADFVGGQALAILWRNSSTRSLQVLHHFGIANLYSSAYWKCDPTAALASYGNSERIVSIPELVSYDEFRQGRFYREWGNRRVGSILRMPRSHDPQPDTCNSVLSGTNRKGWSVTICACACLSCCRISSACCILEKLSTIESHELRHSLKH